MTSRALLLTVDDEPGVLARICGILHRYSINIEELAAVPIESTGRATVTLSLRCEEETLELVLKRLRTLFNVHRAIAMHQPPTATRCTNHAQQQPSNP